MCSNYEEHLGWGQPVYMIKEPTLLIGERYTHISVLWSFNDLKIQHFAEKPQWIMSLIK